MKCMNSIKIHTFKFNPQRVNSSYLSDGLVSLVLNSALTKFIYKIKFKCVFELKLNLSN